MTHFHYRDVAGHYRECDGKALRPESGDPEPSICISADCKVPMVNGDHGGCDYRSCERAPNIYTYPEALRSKLTSDWRSTRDDVPECVVERAAAPEAAIPCRASRLGSTLRNGTNR